MDKDFHQIQIMEVANHLTYSFQTFWDIYDNCRWNTVCSVEEILEQFHKDKLVRKFYGPCFTYYKINLLTVIKYSIRRKLWRQK